MGSTSLTPSSALLVSLGPTRRRPEHTSHRAASRVVALHGTGHAVGPAAAPDQFGPLEADDCALVVGDAHVASEKVHSRYDAKPRALHLFECPEVASVREHEPGT